MEEGSLLQVALDHAKALHTTSANDSLLKNCIFLDLYSLGTYDREKEEHLLYLAKIAEICNLFFQSKGFFWHYGADGPVFGIHLDQSESIPHLRAYCRYGPSVQDSWMAIHYAVELIKSLGDNDDNDCSCKDDIVASLWDIQDGQLILIQLADLLPSWLDEDPTDNHRYACWIDQDGKLQLFDKSQITLQDALQELNRQKQKQKLAPAKSSSHPKMQEALTYWLELNAQAASVHQRAPMVLPRTVAFAFRERPELLRTAIQAFCDRIRPDGPVSPTEIEIDFTKYEDWVWTVQTLSRTNYAMARTVSSSRGDWTSSPDSVPMTVGVEVKRYKRQCKMEGTKHLKHAVTLGVRAVIGLELLLRTNNEKDGIFATSVPLSSLRERIIHWDRVQQQNFSSHKNNDTSRTILESFQMGPNKADLDLTSILKCPVFPEEAHNWTSYSNPESSLRDQITSIMGSKNNDDDNDDDDDERFWVPRPDQVDGEDWMDGELGKGDDSSTKIESQQGLDSLLTRFQSFLNQTSDVEGISSNEGNGNSGPATDTSTSINIRPRIFLNILDSLLKGDKLDFPMIDPFFYQEDYDLIHEESDSDNDDESARNDEGPFQMNDLMNAMDKELEERTESKRIPATILDTSEINAKNEHDRREVKGSIDTDAHILNNLLESLDASGGGSGPVVNILKEMGNSG